MFLFSKERSGLNNLPFEYNHLPELVWKLKFKQLPVRCAESSPVIDAEGNIYFGSHDGCFYCLDRNGKVKWQFVTEAKIYSSPLLSDGKLYFNCNKATIVCLDLSGNLLWQYDAYQELGKWSKVKRGFLNLHSYFAYDYEFKRKMKINAWASPNLLQDQYVVTVLYGIGMIVLNKETGAVHWRYDFGKPGNHLTGAAIFNTNNEELVLGIGQNSGLHCFSANGKLLWKTRPQFKTNAWGNPSVDVNDKSIYYTESYKNKRAIVYKCDYNGNLLWSRKFTFGCRATIGISTFDFVVFLGLDGLVYYLDKASGNIKASKKIADADRGLWTNPALLPNGNVIINTKKSVKKGSLICLSETMETLWEIEYGKALSVPVIDAEGYLYSATWDGDFYKFRETKN